MIRTIAGLIIGLILGATGLATAATDQGAAPQSVDLNVPCQTANQLNCAWYGTGYAPGTSENPPSYSAMQYYSWAKDDRSTFCRYYTGAPFRGLVCATHWPLTSADIAAGPQTPTTLTRGHRGHHIH
jgi:hypothetical protein